MRPSKATLLVAFLVALSAWSGVLIQSWINIVDEGGVVPGVIRLSRYFTILTTTGVALTFSATLLRRRHLPHGLLTGVLLATLITGIVYYLLLAQLRSLSGIDLVADHLLHTTTPALALLFWLGFAPRAPLRGWTPLVWLGWPLTYSIYGVGRGMMEGVYPYYFINLEELDWIGLAISLAQFAAAFAVGGYGLWGVNHSIVQWTRKTGAAHSNPG